MPLVKVKYALKKISLFHPHAKKTSAQEGKKGEIFVTFDARISSVFDLFVCLLFHVVVKTEKIKKRK